MFDATHRHSEPTVILTKDTPIGYTFRRGCSKFKVVNKQKTSIQYKDLRTGRVHIETI